MVYWDYNSLIISNPAMRGEIVTAMHRVITQMDGLTVLTPTPEDGKQVVRTLLELISGPAPANCPTTQLYPLVD